MDSSPKNEKFSLITHPHVISNLYFWVNYPFNTHMLDLLESDGLFDTIVFFPSLTMFGWLV